MRSVHALLLFGAAATALLGACSLVLNTDGITGGSRGEGEGGLDVQPGDAAPDVALDAPDEPWIERDASDGDAQDAESAADSGLDTEAPDVAPGDSGLDTEAPDAAPGDSGEADAPVGDAPAADGSRGDASTCADDLSNTGTADFHIALTVSSHQTGAVALANQRASCGAANFWDLRIWSGNLRFETSNMTVDAGPYSDLFTSGTLVNDGKPHAIAIQRVAGVVTAFIDNKDAGSTPSVVSFGQLAPLVTGTDPCEGHDTTSPFAGTLSGLCVTSP
jgi:hypothetical protein